MPVARARAALFVDAGAVLGSYRGHAACNRRRRSCSPHAAVRARMRGGASARALYCAFLAAAPAPCSWMSIFFCVCFAILPA
jgi:hypothetical protein